MVGVIENDIAEVLLALIVFTKLFWAISHELVLSRSIQIETYVSVGYKLVFLTVKLPEDCCPEINAAGVKLASAEIYG